MKTKQTVYDFLKDIEKQIDEKCNSYSNTISILMLLSFIEERLYYKEVETATYSKKIIKKILGE
jgi:hypothetical protein